MTRDDLVEAIADISQMLKGHMSNYERQLLVADRRDFRSRLEKMDAAIESTVKQEMSK